MAWNPAPEVQVARDAAAAMTKIQRSTVDRCIVLFTLANGKCGYASYGATKMHCGEARRLADAAYETVLEQFPAISNHHRSREPDGLSDTSIDFAKVESEVIDRIRLLAAIQAKLEVPSEVKHAINRDLVMPCMELLMRFVMSVQVDEAVEEGASS